MKKAIFVILLLLFFTAVNAQNRKVDSLKQKLLVTTTDTGRARLLQFIAFYFDNNDSSFKYARQSLQLLDKADYPEVRIYTYRTLGLVYERYGNYPMALKSYLTVLEIAEKSGDPLYKGMACSRLASFFATQQNYNSAVQYLNSLKQIADYEMPQTDYQNKCFAILTIGECYLKLNHADSALKYMQQAYEIAIARNVQYRLPGILGSLGDIHQKLGNDGLALEYYRAYQKAELNQTNKNDFNYQIASLFFKLGKNDSALYYTRLGLQLSDENKSIESKPEKYKLLAAIFDKEGHLDSAYYYTKLSINLKDSINSKEKEQQIQNLNFTEQQRQQEIALKNAEDARERKTNIQYALLALGIVAFIILFLLLSRSFITNEKVIKFFGIIALLIVFEFLNLLLHPFLERITGHSPVLLLLALVCIAALLVPAHHQLEKWMTHTMIEKNKNIRLMAAHKTIEKLGNKNA